MTAKTPPALDDATILSVIVVTWCRPDFVDDCLRHLTAQEPRPHEIIVVDASPDDLTASVVSRFPDVRHVSFPRGAGHMTTARNHGLLHVSGDLIAFLDDDAMARSGWSREIVEAFADPRVGAVAGRTCNGHPGEATEGVRQIGRVLDDGRLTANFAADPGEIVAIDHGIGANMAFRREVLAELGGFRDDFRGVGGVREDTDVFLRVTALRYRTIFSPFAVVDHVGAAHVRGRRFGVRYQFWLRRNHALLLARNYGIRSRRFAAWVASEPGRSLRRGETNARRVAHAMLGVVGIGAGVAASVRSAQLSPTSPKRSDRTGSEIANRLSERSPGAVSR